MAGVILEPAFGLLLYASHFPQNKSSSSQNVRDVFILHMRKSYIALRRVK